MNGKAKEKPKCNDARACFGKKYSGNRCGILTEAYPDGLCPFCKPEVDVTDGKIYPYDEYYGRK